MSYTPITITGVRKGGKVHLELTATEIANINEGLVTIAALEGAVLEDLTAVDSSDDTKTLQFDLSGATTEKTMYIASVHTDDRTITLPDVTGTVVLTAGAQAITGVKTFTTPKIADGDAGVTITSANQTSADATVTIPDCGDAADEFVLKDTAQTLTNKTLTAPSISSPNLSYTINSHDYGAAAVDWTLSAAELKLGIHKVINASGAVNAIIAHTNLRPYLFINGSGQALTVKGASGTGITIANTKSAYVMSDGTNVIRVTADA